MSGVRVTHDDIAMPGRRKNRNNAWRRRRVARSMQVNLRGNSNRGRKAII
jgi:hypothetical protein